MNKQRPTRRLVSPVAASCAVLALAGCSGASATSASTGSTTVTSATTSIELSVPPSTAAPTTSTPTSTGAPTTAIATPPPTTAAQSGAAKPVGASTATLPPVPDQRAAIGYDHPQLGPVTISLSYPDPSDPVPTVRATVNATGETVFEWTGEGGYLQFGFAGASLNPDIKNPVDARGHVFFEYDPGRFPGVSYLVPTATGFDSNGTLTDYFGDGHYLANVIDSDGDGNYEIEQGFQVCTTSCADGYSYSHTWTWDGSAYTGSDVDPNLSPDETAQRKAAKQAFTDYLLAAGARDYKQAWAMLTPSYQDQYGGFEKFTKFWDGIASVGTNWIETGAVPASSGVGEGTSLDVDIWFETTDGTRQTETVGVIMTSDDPPKIAEYTSYGAHD